MATGHGGLVLLDASGRILAGAPTAGRAELVALLGDRIAVVTDRGEVQTFLLP